MITEEHYKQAKEVIKMYEAHQLKIILNKMLPIIKDDEIIEYKDLTGQWYLYTKDLQENAYFIPEFGIKVAKKIIPKIAEIKSEPFSLSNISLDLKFKRLSEMMKWLINGINRHCIPFSLWHDITPEFIERVYNMDFSKK